MKLKFKCKDNDARLKFIECDGLIDEVWVKARKFDDHWTVIGFNDLRIGLELASEKFKKHGTGSGEIKREV